MRLHAKIPSSIRATQAKLIWSKVRSRLTGRTNARVWKIEEKIKYAECYVVKRTCCETLRVKEWRVGYLNEVDGKLCHLVSRVRANPLAKWPYLDETTTISIRLDDKYLDDRANMYFQSVYLYIPIYIYIRVCVHGARVKHEIISNPEKAWQIRGIWPRIYGKNSLAFYHFGCHWPRWSRKTHKSRI